MNKAKELINWSGKTFLIVEDEEVNVQYLQELLRMTHAKLLIAINADEALKLCISHEEIDLVLMDIKLPGMNGYEATKQIKKLRPHLKIIAQTAYAMASDRMTALKSGCDDYIAKPIRANDLLALVNKYIPVSEG
jgi:two-component system, cell cycle response regulator DivK